MVRIDAHVHLWEPVRGDYGWLVPSLQRLFRPFSVEDLWPLLRAADVDGVVLVQAAPTVGETEYLLSIAEETPWILGVVGWIDFESAGAEEEVLRRSAQLVGVRPMLQDLEDPQWILRPGHEAVLRALETSRLVFDALISPVHLPVITELATRYPSLQIVIDHAAKPPVGSGLDPVWRSTIRAAAAHRNVFCKVSGLLTELAPTATAAESISAHFDELLAIFGGTRLIWGSDWPVLTQVAHYQDWFDITRRWLGRLDDEASAAILGGNAARIYGLDVQ